MAAELVLLEERLEPLLKEIGYELVMLEEVKLHGRPTVRLLIDHAEGIKVDDCIKVNKYLMALEWLGDGLATEYDFEISSPGVERPLRRKEHFERFLGEKAQIKMVDPRDGRRKLTGRIAEVRPNSVVMDVDGRTVEVALSNIARAKLKPDLTALLATAARSTI